MSGKTTFKDAADNVRQVFDGLHALFPGRTQRLAALSLTAALFSGRGNVLLMGEHGAGKTKMFETLAEWITIPKAKFSGVYNSVTEVYGWMSELASTVDPRKPGGQPYDDPAGALMSNLIYGVRNTYTELGDKLKVTTEVDLHLFPQAAKLLGGKEPVREPARFYFRQVTKSERAENVLAPALTYKPLLGARPPHVDPNCAAHADVVLFDEALANPMFMADAHKFLFNRVADTQLGELFARPLLVGVAANPATEDYATNPDLLNYATLDRFSFSAFLQAPTSFEAGRGYAAMERLKKSPKKPEIPVEVVSAVAQVVREEVSRLDLAFEKLLLQTLDSCFYNPQKGEATLLSPVSPFINQHDCSMCRFRDMAPCAVANVSPTRVTDDLPYAMVVSAMVNGHERPEVGDTATALLIVLPAKLKLGDAYRYNPYGAINEVIRRYETVMSIELGNQENVFVLMQKLPPARDLTPDQAEKAIADVETITPAFKDRPVALIMASNYKAEAMGRLPISKSAEVATISNVLSEVSELMKKEIENLKKGAAKKQANASEKVNQSGRS